MPAWDAALCSLSAFGGVASGWWWSVLVGEGARVQRDLSSASGILLRRAERAQERRGRGVAYSVSTRSPLGALAGGIMTP
jgi:hypothetical protein